ncbi:MAG: methyltransferase domain-containing protein [archaeon]
MEVIEHLRNPSGALINIRRALKKGGLLILSTPNAHGLSRVRDNSQDTPFSERNTGALHLSIYDYSQLKLLFAFSGFRPLIRAGIGLYIPFIGRFRWGRWIISQTGKLVPFFAENLFVAAEAAEPIDIFELHKNWTRKNA